MIEDARDHSFLPVDMKMYRILTDWVKIKAEINKGKETAPFSTEQIQGVIDSVSTADSEKPTA
jgi:hypothetical protein